MKRTSLQARRDRRYQFWMGYSAWLVRRCTEDGCVGVFTRHLVQTQGHARAMYRADVEYGKAKRKLARRRGRGV